MFMCFSTMSGSMEEKRNRHGPPLWNSQLNTNNFIWKTYNFMEFIIYLGNNTHYLEKNTQKSRNRLQAPNRKGIHVERDKCKTSASRENYADKMRLVLVFGG